MSSSLVSPLLRLASPDAKCQLQYEQLLSIINRKKGRFQGNIQWCSDLSLNDWKIHFLEITRSGALTHVVDMESVAANTQIQPIIENMQGCEIQLLEDAQRMAFPIISVKINSNTIYLREQEFLPFQELLCSLLWWSSFKNEGVSNKLSITTPPVDSKTTSDLLVCHLQVYGPVGAGVNEPQQLRRPNFIKSTSKYAWFPAIAILKSDGYMDLVDQNEGSVTHTVNISTLLRSEIRILDRSLLQDNNCLFLGILPSLRSKLKLSPRQQFMSNTSANQIICRFSSRNELENWLVILQLFAIAEHLSLTGTNYTNKLRISNTLKISILEADFKSISLPAGSELYADINLWDQTWARTPAVSDSKTPFWREEYFFHELVDMNDLQVCIRQVSSVPSTRCTDSSTANADYMLAYVNITQDMLKDPKMNQKLVRLPLLSSENKNFEIGTICVKLESEMNFILPSRNFNQIEKLLSMLPISQIIECAYRVKKISTQQLDEFSNIFLDIYQSSGRETELFQALIDKELANATESIAINTNNNESSMHIYNSLFRGNSLLTKTLEKYFYRIGSDYLEATIGNMLRAIIKSGKSCEVDANRIEEQDKDKLKLIVESNTKRLCKWIEKLWKIIYSSSNDLPEGIKIQLKTVRKKMEILTVDDNRETIFNSISGFLFLRFFCPVILNPKLFDIAKEHLDETSRRTMTLIAKTLLNFSNSTLFGKKEPGMLEMNDFIDSHKIELADYMDKVTQKKLDFTPKIVKATEYEIIHEKLSLSTRQEELLADLPKIPYLIDKYLRETQFIHILANRKDGADSLDAVQSACNNYKDTVIGELEFEKITENNTEIFGDDLLKYLEDDNDHSPPNEHTISLSPKEIENLYMQMKREASLISHKISRLLGTLSKCEIPNKSVMDDEGYPEMILKNSYYDVNNNVFIDTVGKYSSNSGVHSLFQSLSSTIQENQPSTPLNTEKSTTPTKYDATYQENSPNKKNLVGNSSSSSLTRLRSSRLSRILLGAPSDIKTETTKHRWFRSKDRTKEAHKN